MTAVARWAHVASCIVLIAQRVHGSFCSLNTEITKSSTAILRGQLASTTTRASLLTQLEMTRSNQDAPCAETTGKMPGWSTSRRSILSGMTTLAFIGIPGVASAKEDPLFKPNPLTNPVLEKIRIWEQAEADEIKYGGELAPGSPKGREAYAKLLVPILEIQNDLDAVNNFVHQEDNGGLDLARELLEKPQLQNKALKKTFNAHSDNIYFSDPDRANLYLAGGATPRSEQSLAYLFRNDVLTNIESLQAEVTYLIKEKKNGTKDVETEDLYKYARDARDSMAKYIDLIPPAELKLGRELYATKSS